MNKTVLPFLLVAMLSVIGVSPLWADSWSVAEGCKSGAWTYGPSNRVYYNITWQGNYTNWGGSSAGGNIHISGDMGLVNNGTSSAGSAQIEMAIFSTTRSIPSYSKLVRTATFQPWMASNRHHHGGGLYLFDDLNTAKNTWLDATYLQERSTDEGENYKIFKCADTNTSGSHVAKSAANKTITYNNSTGSSAASITKYAAQIHSSATSVTSVAGTEWLSWKESASSEKWYYYKYVSYDTNGGSGSMSQKTIENSGSLTSNTFTRTNYIFTGWNTAANGTGTAYANGAAISATSSDKGPVTLYAQWKRSVSLNADGGACVSSIDVNCYSTYSALPTPTRQDYTFVGWYDAQSGGNQYTPSTASTNDIVATLYARWKRAVAFNPQGGECATASKEVTCHTAYGTLPEPSKIDYSFIGWFDAATDGNLITASTIADTNIPATLYAYWKVDDVSDGDGKQYTSAKTEVETKLAEMKTYCEKTSSTTDVTIARTIYKDGYFNTLCLPFDMTTAQIAATFGEPKQLKQFVSASVQGTGDDREIIIETKDTTGIKAGRAYLISFEQGTDLTQLIFSGVSVTKTDADEQSGDLNYQGILAPKQLPSEESYLFLGDKNRLYWPIADGTFLKGFRAYFQVTTAGPSAPYKRGMKASFGEEKKTPMDIQTPSPLEEGRGEALKLIEEGRVVIKTNGVKYDMNGRKIVD